MMVVGAIVTTASISSCARFSNELTGAGRFFLKCLFPQLAISKEPNPKELYSKVRSRNPSDLNAINTEYHPLKTREPARAHVDLIAIRTKYE